MGTPEKKLPTIRRAHSWWGQRAILLVVFVAGGFVGATIATKAVHSRMQHFRENPNALPDAVLPRLQRVLNLSDEQSAEVREILGRRHPRIVEQRNRGTTGMHVEFDEMEADIASVLDESQASKWKAVANSIRSRFLP